MHTKKQHVVKLSTEPSNLIVTAKGGFSLIEAFGNSTRLWSTAKKMLPQRRDPTQGFSTHVWFSSLICGLITGGRGFSATESLRGDRPLLDIIGIDKAPSAETVEEIAKYLAKDDVQGHRALLDITARHVSTLVQTENRKDLLMDGFIPIFADGTLLETEGKTKDARICVNGAWGQMASAVFLGPYMIASDFSRPVDGGKSEGELVTTRRLLPNVLRTLKDCRLMSSSLVLMDSLYGENKTLHLLEQEPGLHYIVGANKLERTKMVLKEQPPSQWKDTTKENLKRGWEESASCVAWIQCEGWKRKRLLVGLKYRYKGELLTNYSGVVTNLTPEDPRVKSLMKAKGLDFAGAIWYLYRRKQGMENMWKDLLTGMGLHAMPCGKACVNAVMLAIAGLAMNLKTGCARLCLGKTAMTLWRFRRDVIDLSAKVVRHARQVIVTILDARKQLVQEFDIGMGKLSTI